MAAAKSGLGLEITELRLGLPGSGGDKKRVFSEGDDDDHDRSSSNNNNNKKKQVVGWPPVCSYRRKNEGKKMYVKVSMDGAPFLRKIDLTTHKTYSHLLIALDNLFDCHGIGTSIFFFFECYRLYSICPYIQPFYQIYFLKYNIFSPNSYQFSF